MTEERRIVLEMVRDGKITIEEAERLLTAVPQVEHELSVTIKPKRFRIQVIEDGKVIVNVKFPFGLAKAGLKLATVVGSKAPEASNHLKDIDINEILDALSSGDITLPYTFVDVDSDENGKHQHVTIVLE